MDKLIHIRTFRTGANWALLIFRALADCRLSKLKIVYNQPDGYNQIRLPDVQVHKGDFIWITNMSQEDVEQIVLRNSSRTRTIIVQLRETDCDLAEYCGMEEL